MMSEEAKTLIDKYINHEHIEYNLYKLQSDKKIRVGYRGGFCRVDTIYIIYEHRMAFLNGFAHDNFDGYDHVSLTAQDIINIDLSEFMDDHGSIIDFKGLINYLDEKGLL